MEWLKEGEGNVEVFEWTLGDILVEQSHPKVAVTLWALRRIVVEKLLIPMRVALLRHCQGVQFITPLRALLSVHRPAKFGIACWHTALRCSVHWGVENTMQVYS